MKNKIHIVTQANLCNVGMRELKIDSFDGETHGRDNGVGSVAIANICATISFS